MRSTHHRGCFITFEGIEGSGKTTQLARLAKHLRQRGYRVVETREPGGTPLAEDIRSLMLDIKKSRASTGRDGMTPECEAALVFAARSQHVAELIRPALAGGAIVLCDRFFDSTLAYQGYARGLDLRALRGGNRLATGGLAPDLTLLFDLPVAVGLARRRREGTEQNRLDRETTGFHERVRRGFTAMASREPRRIKTIDANRPIEAVEQDVLAIVGRLLTRVGQDSRSR
ncbi:dTMP kinase [Candidatus Nitrospira bockiana]